jgi:predicted metal-dependent hydrolase
MPETPPYTVEYRKVKHPRLEFKTGTLLMILPRTGWTPEQVLEKYDRWIRRKQTTIGTAIKQSSEKALVTTRTEKMLRTLINRYAEAAQKELSTKINKIYFREMRTKWASHSQNNNLTINTLLRYLPEDLISYIIYHESTHNIERKHNEKFWGLVSRKHPDYRTKEEELLRYWFVIQKANHLKNTKVIDTGETGAYPHKRPKNQTVGSS